MLRLFMLSLLAASFLILGGCHTMTFEVSDSSKVDEIKENKSFFFWGLTPHRRIDVLEKCPHGAAAINEQTTFVNGLADFFTLGIWSPRATTYRCIRES